MPVSVLVVLAFGSCKFFSRTRLLVKYRLLQERDGPLLVFACVVNDLKLRAANSFTECLQQTLLFLAQGCQKSELLGETTG